MSSVPRLEAYRFHEREWDSYEQLCDAFEWEVPDRFNMATFVCDRWAEAAPDRVALYAESRDGTERTFTFADLRGLTDRLAAFLAARGVERGDRIGVNAPQAPETAIAHIAAWKLGAVSVPLSTLFGTDALRYRLDDAGARACIVDASSVETYRAVADDLPAVETVLTVGEVERGPAETDVWDAIDGVDGGIAPVDTTAEDDAIVIYTSGTTGTPKGVLHAQRTLLGHLPLFLTSFCNMELSPTDVFWTPSEWAWVATLFDVLFPALYYGNPVVAHSRDGFDPESAFRIVEKYGVTVFFAPATALRMMMQVEGADRYDVDGLRVLPSGGESLGTSVVEWADATFDGAAVHEAYGQTEANMLVGDCTALTPFREGTIGPAGPGHEVRIVDPDTGEPTVAPGEVGEIAVRYAGNPVCFVEYWNRPAPTAAKVPGDWLLTEDLGSMDEDGYLSFVSRKDTVIISAGYRIGPVEIEEALASHDGVAEAAVVGVPDDERGEVPKAFVVPAAGYEPAAAFEAALREHVRDRLAKYEYPREIEFLEALPKTTSGKVRRVALAARDD